MKMPDYAQTNFLNGERPLPDFYWRSLARMTTKHRQQITQQAEQLLTRLESRYL